MYFSEGLLGTSLPAELSEEEAKAVGAARMAWFDPSRLTDGPAPHPVSGRQIGRYSHKRNTTSPFMLIPVGCQPFER